MAGLAHGHRGLLGGTGSALPRLGALMPVGARAPWLAAWAAV